MVAAPYFDDRISEDSIETVEELIEKIKKYNPTCDFELIHSAYKIAHEAHSGQVRRSGEPYIIHPLGVASILADLRLDVSSIATGLLHDVVEDTIVSLDTIEKKFGPVIKDLVDGVTKLSQMKFRHTHEKQGENIRKMIIAMGKDVRVILVKLADRLHNMRTLKHLPFEKQRRIAEETLDIYAPLAGRLGISSLKIELEDLSFRYSQPEQYYDLVQKIQKKKKERDKYIEEVKEALYKEIKSRTQFNFEISGRSKHLYSIYKKMHMRNVDYDQIFDLLAFRLAVNSVAECYEVLGLVHSIYKPIPGRFKDFIAMPKTNNYQSLHTTVVGPGGERIEIQIRTQEMHQIAEWGIAAHWKYKEEARGAGGGKGIEKVAVDKFGWLRELVSAHQGINSSDEFLENIKSDLFESEIYVFTPRGDVKELPEGATPIDFAYSVHTDIGNRIVAARINGKIVTLKHKLRNGDTVEVITSKTQNPSKDWLKICITSRAKARIRAFVKTEQRKRALELGKEMLERMFRKESIPLQKYFSGPKYETLLKDEGCVNLDDLYIRVGYGKVTPQNVIEAIVPDRVPKPAPVENESYLARAFKSAVSRTRKSASVIKVDGMNDVLVRYAKCCLPIPGDPILGFISRGRGITIHRADCQKAFELDTARSIDVEWNKGTTDSPADRHVRLRVTSQDKSGLLKNMSEVFASRGVNIMNVQAKTTRDLRAVSIFDISVRNTKQLNEVISDLQKLPGVIEVQRTSIHS